MAFKRIANIPLFILLLTVLGCKNPEKKAETVQVSKPNIIYILADDLGYGDLGCYGQPDILTPNIDKLSKEGLRFTQHYAGSTVCAPSRNSFITGQHNGHTANKTMERPIREEDVTVAEILKSSGYRTGVIGKWGLGNTGTTGYPNDQGFDYSFGYYDQIRAHNYYPDYLMEDGERYPLDNEVVYVTDSTNYAVGIGSAATGKNEYSNDVFTEKALKYVEDAREDPFFLYLAYTIPHANNESFLIDEHGMEVPDLGIYADKDWPDAKKAGAAMISRLDGYVGSIMEKLKEKGIDKETLVIFTSDNGPHNEGGWTPEFFNSSGNLRGMKRDLYEGGIRVPMIAHWPERIQPGQTDHVSAFWDFLPTVCELTDSDIPENTDGVSYLPTLLGTPDKQAKHEYLYWAFHTSVIRQAVRKEDWKAVRITQGNPSVTTVELFDLSKDESEETDIADAHQPIVTELTALMNQFKSTD